jgi:hypothetical protein
MNKVLTPKGLAQLPTDKKVVVAGQSGVRCATSDSTTCIPWKAG